MSEPIDYEALAGETPVPSDEELTSIADLAKRQLVIETWLAEQEERLREGKRNLKRVAEELLPTAMKAAGLSEITLEDGSKVTIKDEIYASVTEKNKEWCFTWLRENGHGDIIRNEFKTTFGVGEDELAQSLVDKLGEMSVPFSQKEYVHHRTLPAFIRAELAENEHNEEWEQRFGVHRASVSKIQKPD